MSHGERIAQAIEAKADELWDKVSKAEAPTTITQSLAEGMRAAAKIARETPEPSPWISVNDRLPEHMQDVTFVVAPGCVGLNAGRILGGRYIADGFCGFGVPGLGGIPATHWMPLPAPPTEPAR